MGITETFCLSSSMTTPKTCALETDCSFLITTTKSAVVTLTYTFF